MPELAAKLVGRTAELGSLDQALAGLERRRSSVLAVVGEPGMGKTRLLAELVARAEERRHLVLSGSASELEGDLPFWAFVDALDEYVHALEPWRLDALGHESLAELGRVLPSLPAPAPRGADRYRTYRAVRQLLEALADPAPLVLVLDDLHWADAGSIELLGSLLRRPPDAGVLIALAVRPRQMPERLASTLDRAEGSQALTRLELGALDRAEAAELLGARIDDADLGALYAGSGGNPFYLQQLCRAPRRPGERRGATGVPLAGVEVPGAVAAALTDELALLPPAPRRLLEGASVAGDPFELDLAASAGALEEPDAMNALDELLRRDLVRHTDVPRRFRFRHPLVRGAVYEAAPGGWRLGAHERCATLLAERGVPAVERAHHVERAARHGDPAAVAVLREAGEALLASAPAVASRHFGTALRLVGPASPERLGLLRSLAGAHWGSGRFAEAHAATVEILDLLPEDAVGARVQLTATCAALEHLLGRHDDAHARLVAGLRLAGQAGGPEDTVLELHLGVDAFYRLDVPAMLDWSRRAVESADASGDRPMRLSALGGRALSLAFAGDVPEGERAFDAAVALFAGLTDEEVTACLEYGGGSLSAAALSLGRFHDAGAIAERTLAVARASGRGAIPPVLFWAGCARASLGRLDSAAEVLDTAIEITRVTGHASSSGWNLFARSFVATAAGDVATALSCAEESREVLARFDDALPTTWSAIALSAALVGAGEAERAIEVLVRAAGGDDLPRLPAVWRPDGFELLTHAQVALGRVDDARRSAAAAERCADALGLAMARVRAERSAAAVALAAGGAAVAAHRALRAAEVAEEAGAVVEGALARLVAGRALASAGDKPAAAEQLIAAAGRFDDAGALRHRDAAEHELQRVGRRRPHRRSGGGTSDGASGPASLTERELQIARLIVDRRTNAQIAAELFLSPKTVETHVRNLFHKLGVSSRVDVARIVERAERQTRAPDL
jgi:ATP/maltotriose-dependent transcriptional regulator MalT